MRDREIGLRMRTKGAENQGDVSPAGGDIGKEVINNVP
jgi:hypothetical protein